MATECKTCGNPIEWGWDSVTNRWVPLEPLETHDYLPRTFVDETGTLRADHRDSHKGQRQGGINVMRLDKKVPPAVANEKVTPIRRPRGRPKKAV